MSDEALVTQDDIDFAKALYATERGTWPESIARWRSSRIASARAEGRREGIEEAARVAEGHNILADASEAHHMAASRAKAIATAIRAMIKEEPKV